MKRQLSLNRMVKPDGFDSQFDFCKQEKSQRRFALSTKDLINNQFVLLQSGRKTIL
jgi:hypothetical protein